MQTWEGVYSTPNTMGSARMRVQAQSSFHAEELIKAQTGADTVYNLGVVHEPRRMGTNNSGENSAGGLGGLIILGLLGMGLLGLFGDDETPKTKQYNSSQAPQVERTYTPPVQQSQARGWSYQRSSSDNFFTNSGIQEEAIDDLGQDWDN
jgi:hypothetical protein